MKSYSQAGQDRFVHELLVKTKIVPRGTFLDIGCAGKLYSNTLALEEIGWRGTLMDVAPQPEAMRRPSTFIQADATEHDWGRAPVVIDYLSLDVDEAGLRALARLPLDTMQFRVITIEHDAYRYGEKLRPFMRQILSKAGYVLVCADVCNPVPFEDWWVLPALMKGVNYEKYLCKNKQWQLIFPHEAD
jgi:hypothetical protein